MPPSAIRLDQMDALELPELLVLVVPTFFAGAVVVLGVSVPCLDRRGCETGSVPRAR